MVHPGLPPSMPSGGTRSHCEMAASPTVDNRDETARQTLYTVCY